MQGKRIEDLLKGEIMANERLDNLLVSIINGGRADELIEAWKRASNLMRENDEGSVTALEYSRGMSAALSEQDFRWLDLSQTAWVSRSKRRECGLLYRRLKSLFESEIAITRKQKRNVMALASDWSGLPQYLRESLAIARYRLMLNLAGWLFATAIPGASDICDAAVFGMVRTVYLPAA